MNMGKNFVFLLFLFLIFVSFALVPSFLFEFNKVGIPKEELITNELKQRENSEATIILTGDIMLGRTVEQKSKEMNDFTYPFKKTAEFLKSADLVFVNLENPIISDCPPHSDGFKFCANPEMAEGLSFAGVDVVTLANNHTLNYGIKGRDQTVDILKTLGIESVGYGNLVIREVEGTKFGFLGFDFVSRGPTFSDLELVRSAGEKVGVLIVGVHWAEEYKNKANEGQMAIAKRLVDLGADVVVGHHPHWVQNVEYINEKPVFYSLGNFVFDQMWSEETKKGLVVKLTFENGKLIREERLSIYMPSWAQPEFIE